MARDLFPHRIHFPGDGLRFFRRSGSRVSIQNPVTTESVLGAPPVSRLTICPLGQPEKAIGHESQIEPWLAHRHHAACPRQKPKAFCTSKNESSKRKRLGTSPDHAGWKPGPNLRRVLALGEVFCLDFPFYRTGYRTSSSQRERTIAASDSWLTDAEKPAQWKSVNRFSLPVGLSVGGRSCNRSCHATMLGHLPRHAYYRLTR